MYTSIACINLCIFLLYISVHCPRTSDYRGDRVYMSARQYGLSRVGVPRAILF